jgi:uncharacterized integral membrane protein
MSTVPPDVPSPDHGPGVPRTRTAGLWIASVLFALVLLLLLVFILQNGQRAEVSFFGFHSHPPVGVALLLAAVFGILLVALPGTARIVQLRLLARRRALATAPAPPEPAPVPPPRPAPDVESAPPPAQADRP